MAFVSLYVQKAYFATLIAILTAIDNVQTSAEQTGYFRAQENEAVQEKLYSSDFLEDPSKLGTTFGFEQCKFQTNNRNAETYPSKMFLNNQFQQ